MAKYHRRLLIGIVVGIAVSAVGIGSSAINSRTPNADFEATDKVRVPKSRRSKTFWLPPAFRDTDSCSRRP